MKVLGGVSELTENYGASSVVTIGNFDGVHRGHERRTTPVGRTNGADLGGDLGTESGVAVEPSHRRQHVGDPRVALGVGDTQSVCERGPVQVGATARELVLRCAGEFAPGTTDAEGVGRLPGADQIVVGQQQQHQLRSAVRVGARPGQRESGRPDGVLTPGQRGRLSSIR